jgi:hypothetical protein
MDEKKKTKAEILSELKRISEDVEKYKEECYKILEVIDNLEKEYIDLSEELKK